MKIFSFSLMMSLTLTLATVGIVTAITTIPTQTADATTDCKFDEDSISCSGGGKLSGQPGGSGQHGTLDLESGDQTLSGGVGAKDFPKESTNGRHCEFNHRTGESECVGEHFSGNPDKP
jgi:hypothetical protein